MKTRCCTRYLDKKSKKRSNSNNVKTFKKIFNTFDIINLTFYPIFDDTYMYSIFTCISLQYIHFLKLDTSHLT